MRGCLAALRRWQSAPRRGQAVASDLRCSSVQFRFCRFVRINSTVNPISIPFSPTHSTQLILSYFSVKSYFYIPKKKKLSHNHLFSKNTQNHFYSKSQFSLSDFSSFNITFLIRSSTISNFISLHIIKFSN